MGKITVLKNTAITIDLLADYQDNGWTTGSGIAYHNSCNQGNFTHNYFKSEIGETYNVKYRISGIVNGTFKATIGGVDMDIISDDGYYEGTVEAINTSGISFWSDADLELSELYITAGQTAYNTLIFNNDNNKWSGYVSYTADFMTKFLDDFYTFRNGELWKHNVNDKRNNFYGVQYPSIIKFVVNIEPTVVKNMYSMRIVGNKPWNVSIEVPPRLGKSRGQKSRIKRGNFKNLQGQFFGNFMKDMNDPRFSTELEALLKGADLQGQVAIITMEINEEDEVKLVSVDTEMSDSQYSY